MAKRIAVVISQGQSAHPAKRSLEEDIVTALLMEPGIDVTVIPHLYDLKSDGTGMLALQGIKGDMIVMSWLFERAARWTLDRQGIRGLEGRTQIKPADGNEDEGDVDGHTGDGATSEGTAGARNVGEIGAGDSGEPDDKFRVAAQREVPRRRIYCVDLRVLATAQPYVDEVRRIAAEGRVQLVPLGGRIEGRPSVEQAQRFLRPTNDTALPLAPPITPPNSVAPLVVAPLVVAPLVVAPHVVEAPGEGSLPRESHEGSLAGRGATRIAEDPDRRWYPVIDFSRCTNCMECIDFCLFGVYGIDRAETILVEQPDNCRKGCPACSRVCPENAIIFPQHKTPAIAGAPVGLVSLKIDLSKLFGAPAEGKSAQEIAALERDEQLVIAGRQPAGIPKRQEGRAPAARDDLDALLDELDEANL